MHSGPSGGYGDGGDDGGGGGGGGDDGGYDGDDGVMVVMGWWGGDGMCLRQFLCVKKCQYILKRGWGGDR